MFGEKDFYFSVNDQTLYRIMKNALDTMTQNSHNMSPLLSKSVLLSCAQHTYTNSHRAESCTAQQWGRSGYPMMHQSGCQMQPIAV